MKRKNIDYEKLKNKLDQHLNRAITLSAKEACTLLDISQPVFSRFIQKNRPDYIVTGQASKTIYAGRRIIPDVGTEFPLYDINQKGKLRHIATIHGIRPEGFYVESFVDEIVSGFFEDLPWFLYDIRPQGFLGRFLPEKHPELYLPADIRLWTADNCIKYFVLYGCDLVGNLIAGEEATKLYMQKFSGPANYIKKEHRKKRYPEIADNILSTGSIGSSAGGEQPKFLATLDLDNKPSHVIVKFSPAMNETSGRRIADLLVCEHIAHNVIKESGRKAPESNLVIADNRMFLEIKRFDRTGAYGRSGVLSIASFDFEFTGKLSGWHIIAEELQQQGILTADITSTIQWLELFGHMIANTDMHPGNLSFTVKGTQVKDISPVYDMLPMLYYPRQGQIINVNFSLPAPKPSEGIHWISACEAAISFWTKTSKHSLISPEFKRIAKSNIDSVSNLMKLADILP